jgi:hypothetical protein
LARGWAFARILLDRSEFFADPLVGLDLFDQKLGRLGILVQPEDQLLLDGGYDPAADLGAPELVLGLAVEDGILESDADGADDSVPDVVPREALVRKLVDALQDALAEGRLVGSSIVRVLAVHEAEVGLAVAMGVGEREFEPLLAAVDDRVERWFVADFVAQEIGEPIGTVKAPAVVEDAQARVEIGVIAKPVLDELFVPRKCVEDLAVGGETDQGAGRGFGIAPLLVLLEHAAFESGGAVALLSPTGGFEAG